MCEGRVERGRNSEAIGLGKRNAPVGCPQEAASSQLATEIESGRRSSGCLGIDSALAQGRDALQQKVTCQNSHMFKESLTVVGCSFPAMVSGSNGQDQVKNPQGASGQTALLHETEIRFN